AVAHRIAIPVDVLVARDDVRRQEEIELARLVTPRRSTEEERPNERDSTQEWDSRLVARARPIRETPDHRRLTVPNEDLCRRFALVDDRRVELHLVRRAVVRLLHLQVDVAVRVDR